MNRFKIILPLFAACIVFSASMVSAQSSIYIPDEPSPGSLSNTPLQLPELEQLTFEYNPLLKQAYANREAARARLTQAQSGFWPQLGAEASANASRNELQRTGLTNNRLVGLNFSQTLFDYPLWWNSEAADLEAVAQDQMVLAVRNEVLAELHASFFNVLVVERMLYVALEQEKDTAAFQDKTEKLLQHGLAAPLDLARANLDHSEAQRQVIEAKTGLRKRHALLAQAVGLADVYHEQIGDQPTANEKVLVMREGELVTIGLRDRPDVKQLDYLVQAAEASADAAFGGHLPTLDFRGNVGRTGDYDLERDYYSYGLYLNLPLFNGLRVHGSYLERKALIKANQQAWERRRHEVRREIQTAYLSLKEAQAKVEVGKVLLISAEENWRLVQGRYDNGLATPLELSEARTQRFKAQSELEQDQIGILLALSELDRAVGGTLLPFNESAKALEEQEQIEPIIVQP